METHQLNLFADNLIPKSAGKSESLSMDAEALVQWKAKVAAHQQRAKAHQLVQGTLFNVAKAHIDPDKIDPFSLSVRPMSFYRLPTGIFGTAWIYFLVDNTAELVLYIGETNRSNIRLTIDKPA